MGLQNFLGQFTTRGLEKGLFYFGLFAPLFTDFVGWAVLKHKYSRMDVPEEEANKLTTQNLYLGAVNSTCHVASYLGLAKGVELLLKHAAPKLPIPEAKMWRTLFANFGGMLGGMFIKPYVGAILTNKLIQKNGAKPLPLNEVKPGKADAELSFANRPASIPIRSSMQFHVAPRFRRNPFEASAAAAPAQQFSVVSAANPQSTPHGWQKSLRGGYDTALHQCARFGAYIQDVRHLYDHRYSQFSSLQHLSI